MEFLPLEGHSSGVVTGEGDRDAASMPPHPCSFSAAQATGQGPEANIPGSSSGRPGGWVNL